MWVSLSLSLSLFIQTYVHIKDVVVWLMGWCCRGGLMCLWYTVRGGGWVEHACEGEKREKAIVLFAWFAV